MNLQFPLDYRWLAGLAAKLGSLFAANFNRS